MIIVNNKELPLIVQQQASNKWFGLNYSKLELLTKVPIFEDFDFLSIDSMIINTKEFESEFKRGDGDLFGLSSIIKGCDSFRIDGFICYELAVIIAATHGDDAICLYYEEDKPEPVVIVSDWSVNKCRWKLLASNFEEFWQWVRC
jgi:hypothetical protein